MASSTPIKLVQITDTHLYGDDDGTLLKMNTADSLYHVVKLMKQNEADIDLLLATGDIAQDASIAAYEKFITAIKPLNSPCHWIPGNHDVATVMKFVAKDAELCNKTVQINNWNIVMLDSSVVGQVHGRLSADELDFLQTELDSAEKNSSIDHCVICLHHNPVPGTADWMKDIGLQNDQRFLNALGHAKKVKAVIYGHIHQALDFEQQGIRFFCTPSTCIQFKPDATGFALDDVNPGYRRFELHADGSIDSEVVRLTDHELDIDLDSEGY
ncbi:MAG: 3',5'-cyclic-AMP phosphodiesterase [Pseudohongiellaceae bacterium]